MSVTRSAVTGVGSYLPENIVTNDDLSKFVDTTDEWIVERTGIRQRHKAADDQPTSDLAVQAALRALEGGRAHGGGHRPHRRGHHDPRHDLPVGGLHRPAQAGPPVCNAFDIQAVCSGFVYALSVADGFVARGLARCALVIGAEEMTRLMDWTDRSTCVLFGDGAGAVVLEPVEGQGTPADRGVLGFALRCDGNKTDLLYVDGGPASTGTVGHLRMAGNQVFRHAVVNIAEAVTAACEAANIQISDVDWFVPHQANQRIIKGVGDRLGLDEDKVILTVADHANTSAASIPLALDTAVKDGRIKPGDLVLMEAMGGGLTWGAVALRM
ncbi:beta-ketoacyl-ACP synthase III [Brevundimonas denitrificans]|uniref:beta-ketoacyl-ACP synthase III n=1 Tax=Brevundimonas denitrificans TaxID=1443434 RepID=UPI00223A9F1C|nr:beta-ketoacyl-ACP synthase III [Brevundimonas denitrificans]